jgi:hypothetical protein
MTRDRAVLPPGGTGYGFSSISLDFPLIQNGGPSQNAAMQSAPQRSPRERTDFPGQALNPVLAPFLSAPQRSAAEHDRLRVLMDGVTPVIDGVIRGRAGVAVASSEREELFSEVLSG